MRIVHLSKDDITGGAAIAAYRIHQGLLSSGADSKMLVKDRASHDPTVLQFKYEYGFFAKVRRRLRMSAMAGQSIPGRMGYEAFHDDRTLTFELPGQLPACDIIHLHSVNEFIDYGSLFSSIPNVPVVWTMHDINPFTGGCHYAGSCEGFRQACGICPGLPPHQQLLTTPILHRKQRALAKINGTRLVPVGPSQWIVGEAKKSVLFGRFDIRCIPYGLDTMLFTPGDRAAIRQELKIPANAKVILFVAADVRNLRKGFRFLAEAMPHLKRLENALAVGVGLGTLPECDLPQMPLGNIKDPKQMARIYSAADVLVAPSLEDNLPQTVLEALACGTPAVGFATGGIGDMIRPGVTGHLASVGDSAGLAQAILKTLEDESARQAMSRACRQIVLDEYPLDLQARRYLSLYQSIL